MGESLMFDFFGALAALTAFGVIWCKNPVTSAMMLVMTLCSLAAIYVIYGAEFAAAVQILVYAGAIVVLFTFVIMLLNLNQEESGQLSLPRKIMGLGGVTLGFSVLVAIAWNMYTFPPVEPMSNSLDNTYQVGMALFTTYLWPFELLSMLILLAVVASIVIARKPGASAPDA